MGDHRIVVDSRSLARRRQHAATTTEHLLYALVVDSGDGGNLTQSFLAQHYAGVRARVAARLDALPWFGEGKSGGGGGEGKHDSDEGPAFSPTLREVLALADAVRAAGERAGRGAHGMCSEYLFGGLLLHPRAVAREELALAARDVAATTTAEAGPQRAALTAPVFLNALGLRADAFAPRVRALRLQWGNGAPWTEVIVKAPAPKEGKDVEMIDAGGASTLRLPPPVVDNFEAMRGPTPESNWMVRGRVVTGMSPDVEDGGGRGTATVTAAMRAGVDTFVCLRETPHAYRRAVERALRDGIAGGAGASAVSLLHFPIDDFSVAGDAQTAAFVEELARRVHGGSVLYVHCWSGRGRTGTVAIPLLMALYPALDVARATELVNRYKQHGRAGRTRGGHMPEDRSQRRQIAENEMPYKRGGHKAKQK